MESGLSLAQLFQEPLHPLFYVGMLLVASYAGGQIAARFGIPRVSGYLIMGMLLSPSMLNVFHETLVKEELSIVTNMALAIIAFSIGGSLGLGELKRIGKQILWINVTEAFGAFFVGLGAISLFFYLFHFNEAVSSSFWDSFFPMALVIGAISAATAPAATLAIVHEYRAKGPFTSIFLGVVALDDSMAILLYAFAVSIAKNFIHHEALSFFKFFFLPSLSILASLAIGAGVGWCLGRLIRFVPRRPGMLAVMPGSIFLTSGLAFTFHAHPLLANMMLGFVVMNFVQHHEDLFGVVETIEEPLFGMFFMLAGAHLDLSLIETAGFLALVITLGRFAGKILGVRLGASISQAPDSVKNYLGLALLPTAGVTVGLVLEAADVFTSPYLAEIMINGVLGSVVINELLTPFFVRFSLFRAGEAVKSETHRPKD